MTWCCHRFTVENWRARTHARAERRRRTEGLQQRPTSPPIARAPRDDRRGPRGAPHRHTAACRAVRGHIPPLAVRRQVRRAHRRGGLQDAHVRHAGRRRARARPRRAALFPQAPLPRARDPPARARVLRARKLARDRRRREGATAVATRIVWFCRDETTDARAPRTKKTHAAVVISRLAPRDARSTKP